MGLLKDLRRLARQSRKLSKDWDPSAQVQQASAALRATNEAMTRQAAAAHLAVSGEPAMAQLTEARDTGTLVNLQPVIELGLLIFPEGRPPYPVTLRHIVPVAQVGRLIPGTMLPASIDPADPDVVWIDWLPA